MMRLSHHGVRGVAGVRAPKQVALCVSLAVCLGHHRVFMPQFLSPTRSLRRSEQSSMSFCSAAQHKVLFAATRSHSSSAPATAQQVVSDDSEDSEAATYKESRLQQVRSLQEAYPHKWPVDTSIPEAVKLGEMDQMESSEPRKVTVAGRIKSKRTAGKKLTFYDLAADGSHIQVLCRAPQNPKTPNEVEEFQKLHAVMHRNDLLGVRGTIGRSKSGELSIIAEEVKLLAPCLHMLPKDQQGLKDQETRFRKRYLDLLLNPRVRQTLQIRSKIVNFIRAYLDGRGFLEVETPTMNMVAAGAAAKPFITHHNELDLDFYLRIATEIPLKMLVIGGLDRVYEIGRIFRNEGIDLTHNPEFTTLESMEAYADYKDVMDMTEELVSSMVFDMFGTYKIQYHPDGPTGKGVEIDFAPPWPRLSMVEEIERKSGVTFSRDFTDPKTVQQLDDLVKKLGLECPPPRSAARLMDKLCGHYIEDGITNPTFITEHPQVMSPLAKWHREKEGLTERFEAFVCGKEFANAYTELNDPAKQLEFFKSQVAAKDSRCSSLCRWT